MLLKSTYTKDLFHFANGSDVSKTQKAKLIKKNYALFQGQNYQIQAKFHFKRIEYNLVYNVYSGYKSSSSGKRALKVSDKKRV